MSRVYPIFPGNKSVALFIFGLFLMANLQAQKKFKDYLVSGSAMFVAGLADGTKEAISYHYETGFKRRLPGANDQFWNPAVSWKNKYKNGDCNAGPKFAGSTNVLVFTTDAYHLLRTTQRVADIGAVAWALNKDCNTKSAKTKKWKVFAKDFLIHTAIRCAGFNLTYNFLFNQSKNYHTN